MALIKCPECGHMISDFSDKCISCGCPMSKIKDLMKSSVPLYIENSASEVYQQLNKQEKELVDDLCDFISSHKSNLVKVDHKKTFGFKHKGKRKTAIVFKYRYKKLVLNYKSYKKSNTIRITSRNLNQIKDELTTVFFTKNSGSIKQQDLKTSNFFESRKDYERHLIEKFTLGIKDSIPGIIVKNNAYTYSYKITENDSSNLCWFGNGANNKLVFKYHKSKVNLNDIGKFYPVYADINKIINLAVSAYESTNNDIEEIEEEKNKCSCRLFKLICKAIKNPLEETDEISSLANEVGVFVLNEIRSKAIEQKYFKNEKEFDTWKFTYRYIPNFFGYTFSLRKITEEDACVFYDFYKASCVISKIKEYEKIYNKLIVTDYNILLHDLYDMISSKSITFSRAKGLTANFGLIPEETLINVICELTNFTKQ